MELKVSAEKPGFSSSEGTSDPEDQEISEGEDEDDDRNHKHRRREAHSQSLEGNSIGQDFTIPYRKRNRTLHNGYSYRDGEPQSSEACEGYGFAPDRGFGARLEKKHFNQGSLSGTPSDAGHRFRGNQTLRSEIGSVRGRGRETFMWGTHDPRVGMTDASPHIVPPGSISSALFGGRTMAGISVQGPSWTSFGLIPGVPCGGLDSMHPLGLQGALGPVVNPQINLGLAKQRCRDFEERGFCLRGDMCPMEHGVNRIVIDDFQSLSQFNLPVSIPGSQLLGTSSVQGTFPALGSNPGASVKSKAFHVKGGKSGVSDEGVQGGSLPLSSDLYDPDQPLLTNGNTKSSSGLLNLNQRNVDGADTFTDADVSNQKSIDSSYVEFNNGLSLRNPTTAPGFQNASMWGRQRSSGENGKRYAVGLLPGYVKQDGKGEEVLSSTPLPDNAHQRLQLSTDANSLLDKETPSNLQRKPSQKALRTLFVNGIPLKDNKKEALLTHFRKFGEVIDIYIPMNGERAFVQFSKTEEAELALKSPDAVMGNRFIKLWWANRDNISDDGKQGASNLTVPQRTIFNPSTSKSAALEKGGENHPIPPPAHGSNRRPPAVASKTPVQQQKLENLERLKEELRKKQQMLDQKRNEFKRQLNKLEKQTTKDNTVTDKSNKIQPPKAETPERDRSASSEQSAPPVPELSTPLRQLASPGASAKRFKLDNRPTAFKIASPVPAGLAKVDALEEHFKSFGGFSSVELEEGDDVSSARVSFTSRKFAEKAFSQGTSWKGQKLRFVWPASVKSAEASSSSCAGGDDGGDDGPKSSPSKEQVC